MHIADLVIALNLVHGHHAARAVLHDLQRRESVFDRLHAERELPTDVGRAFDLASFPTALAVLLVDSAAFSSD